MNAADLTAGSATTPVFDTSASNGALAAAVDEAVTGPTVPFAAAWDQAAAYTKGQTVTFDGHLWVATWWAKGREPGDPNGAWQQIATTESGVAVWTHSRIFVKGDVVVHEGATYAAKWWTRDHQPNGAARGPWDEVDRD